ncbi:MAG: PH domain-containing protein [bacterium]|nr:PH domain-containing protein [bacterium]
MKDVEHTQDQGRNKLSDMGKKYFDLIEFDEQEELLLEVRKHWFGLFTIIVTGTIVSSAVLLIMFTAASGDFLKDVGLDNSRSLVAFTGYVIFLLSATITLISAILYRSNVIYITNEKIAQVLYLSVFNRKVSQLNIGDVQDVTVQQKGILASTFNYGRLVIETAGEQQNYTFSFVPDPSQAAKVIIQAHEVNLKLYGN